MSPVAQVSQWQTSSAHRKPLASEGQEAKPEIRHFRSHGPFVCMHMRNKELNRKKLHTVCGLWAGGFIFNIIYSMHVALNECPPTVYAA